MEQVDSELIIVDTGCDEETYAILLEYTSQIIKFKWCNDFSKARNVGLKLAKGEWFLYIDDDEWFIDVGEIVEFFQSGAYKDYGIACYIQRNYSDYEENRYSDSWVSRMIRLDSDTRFVSSIHEYLYPVKGECKLLHAPVKHFGYIFDSEEERYKHSERNISLLLDMIKKERKQLRWWVQLAQEYRGIREYRKLEELCKDAIQLIEKMDDYSANKERGAFYSGCILAELATYRIEEAENLYKKAIKDKRNTTMCQARLYGFGAEIYFRKEDYETSERCCEQYLHLYDKLKNNEKAMLEQGAFFVTECFEEIARNSVYSWYICCRLKKGDTETLNQYFDKFDWKGNSLTLHSTLIPAVMDAMAVNDYQEYFVKIAETMIKRKGPDQEVLTILMQKEKVASEEEYKKLAKIFSQVDYKHYYIWYTKIRNIDFLCAERECSYKEKSLYKEKNPYEEHSLCKEKSSYEENGLYKENSPYEEDGHTLTEQEQEQLQECYHALFCCVVDIFKLDESVWEIAERYHIDLEPLFLNIKFDQWKNGIDSFCENTSLEKIEERVQLVEKMKKQKNIRYDYFSLKAAEARIVYGMGREDLILLRKLLCSFVEKNLSFYGVYYKENAFEGEMELLPVSCRLAVRLKRAFDSEPEGSLNDTMNSFKECMGIFPSLEAAIKKYVKLYGEKRKQEIEESATFAKKAKEEMHRLAFQIKQKIHFLIEENRIAEAKDVLKQLRSYIPEDASLDRLEHEIQIKLS